MSNPERDRSQREGHTAGSTAAGGASLRIPAQTPYVPLVGQLVQWFGQQAGLDDDERHDLEVAVDEACTNVVRHAFPETAPGEMTICCSPVEAGVKVEIFDMGKRFDPAEGEKVALKKRSHDSTTGGMGLALIRHLADAFSHDWSEQQGNHLTLVKYNRKVS